METVQINKQAYDSFTKWLEAGGPVKELGGMTISPLACNLILNTLQGPLSGFKVVSPVPKPSDAAPAPAPVPKVRKPRKTKDTDPEPSAE